MKNHLVSAASGVVIYSLYDTCRAEGVWKKLVHKTFKMRF